MFDMHGETVCYNEKDETAVIITRLCCPVKLSRLSFGKKRRCMTQ